MSDTSASLRQQHLGKAKRVVIKVGSSLLARSPVGQPASIADELHSLRDRNLEIVVVSSGAIALGFRDLGLATRPRDLAQLQAAAAIGQSRLLNNWEHAFGAHGRSIAQILLTHDDLRSQLRSWNARHALRVLLRSGIIPIINENDTVAVDEIRFGDNDQLASMVAGLVGADALVIYTDVNGLHDAAPQAGGKRIPIVHDVDSEALPFATSDSTSGVGSGGMASKVSAAKRAQACGVATAIVAGATVGTLSGLLRGEDIGTLFVPPADSKASQLYRLRPGEAPAGELHLREAGAQNIARGVRSEDLREVRGDFGVGAPVRVFSPKQVEIARGLAGYPSDDLRKLCGCTTSDIEARLGYKYLDEVVFHDDLVTL